MADYTLSDCYKADTCMMDSRCPGWVNCRLVEEPEPEDRSMIIIVTKEGLSNL